MLFSNLSALIKSSADDTIRENSNKNNKYRYQSNRSFIIGQMKVLLPKMLFDFIPLSTLDDIYFDACRVKSQVQPCRKFKRKRVEKHRTHFRNKKPAY